ncbi:MAG: hypothetical protein IJG38_06335 [Thermoguttaceae bacterium]|nr:hypothetical protein [Thermoguttaceae bacterium]
MNSTELQPIQEKNPNEQTDVVFLYALSVESAPLEGMLKKSHTEDWHCCQLTFGRLGDLRVAVVQTGAGQKKAAKSARRVINRLHPNLVYSVGFAGALNPELERFQILDPVYPMNYQPANIIDVSTSSDSKKQWGLYTADHVVAKLSEKARLFEKYGMDAVDMETDAVAEVCQDCGVELRCIRIISDDAKEELPPDIENILNQNSGAEQWGAALGALFRKPSRALDLIKLKNVSVQAAQTLAEHIVKMLEEAVDA